MQQVIHRILTNNLSDFEGLNIKGKIPISEEIVNQLISSYVDAFFSSNTASNSGPDSDYTKLFKKLKPYAFKISFEQGKAIIDFELQR